MTINRNGRWLRQRPRIRLASQRRTISPDSTTHDRLAQLLPPVTLEPGDLALMDRLGFKVWHKLPASRPCPELSAAVRQRISSGQRGIIAGPWAMAMGHAKLCRDYLAARGINDATVKTHGLELDDRLSAATVKARLGRGLPNGVSEILWCPLHNSQGNIYSYIARVLPNIPNLGKFICPVGSDGPPYIPKPIFGLPVGRPLIIPEGPIKALACVQAGYDAIGLNGVYGAGVKDSNGEFRIRADLLAALEWRGRKVYLAFDADLATNPDVRHAMFPNSREWVHLEIPMFYLYQRPDDKFWVVIDRTLDIAVGKAFKRKAYTIRWFVKHWNPPRLTKS